MKRTLSDHERDQLDKLIAETEKLTKTQIVLAVIERSDTYSEVPWKAFALGASIAGLLAVILNLPIYDWIPRVTALVIAAVILAGGAALAFLTVLVPGFARLLLPADRTEVEVQQYTAALFLEREVFTTSGRTGILLLVSLFERRVVILPDKGLGEHLTNESLHDVIATMTPFLKQNEVYRAFESGLERLTEILGTVLQGTGENELPDEIIEEKGV